MRSPAARPEQMPPRIRSWPRWKVCWVACRMDLAYIALRRVLAQRKNITNEVQRPADEHIAIRSGQLGRSVQGFCHIAKRFRSSAIDLGEPRCRNGVRAGTLGFGEYRSVGMHGAHRCDHKLRIALSEHPKYNDRS